MIRGVDFAKFDRRIVLQSPTENRDATYNQITYGYTDVATVWATIGEPTFNRNNETINDGNKVNTGRRKRYTIRYSGDVSGVNEKWRILDGAETFEVSDVAIWKREGFIRIEGVYNGVAT